MRATLDAHARQRSRLTTRSDFHPIGDMEWYSAYWPEGDAFAAEGYTNGAAVDLWPDEVGSNDLTVSSTTKPVYESSIAAFSKPGVRFASGRYIKAGVNHSSIRGYVTIAYLDNVSTNRFIDADGSSAARVVPGHRYLGTYQLYAGGTALQSATYIDANHLFSAYIAAGSGDRLKVDNATIYSGASVGDGLHTRVNLGNNGTHSGASLVFGGFTTVDPETQTNWAPFLDWAEDYYGITMA